MIKKNNGFTTLEIMVSLMLFVMVILLVGSMFIISQKSYNKGSRTAELTQNARVTLDRMSREIRQSTSIVTSLNPDGGVAVHEIFFQDGHDSSQITYIRYYLSGTDLMRRHVAYYFDTNPGIYVVRSSVDGSGNPPSEMILEDRIVGEFLNKLEFWGTNGLITISVEFLKNDTNVKMKTKIFSRNK